MNRMLSAVLIGLVFYALPVGCYALGKEGKPRNIVLIGWDGAQREHIREDLRKGKLAHLQKLAREGALVAIDILRTTDTKSGWAQILTGYEPERTGVYSNGHYGPIPRGYSIFERLERHFGRERFVTVAVIAKKDHVGAAPAVDMTLEEYEKRTGKNPAWRKRPAFEKFKKKGGLVEENGKWFVRSPAEPYALTKDSLDVWVNGLEKDETVGETAMSYLEKYQDKPFFFFIHFAQIDHRGHQFGENSREADAAYVSADAWTGRIMDKLKDLGLAENTLVYVTSDHGFDEGMKSHYDAPYVFLATNDRGVMRRGTRADIAPTILDRFGVDLDAIEPRLDGHSLLRPYTEKGW